MAAPAAIATIYSEAEVAAMSARQYMDELVVPTLLRALASVNKEVRLRAIYPWGYPISDISRMHALPEILIRGSFYHPLNL